MARLPGIDDFVEPGDPPPCGPLVAGGDGPTYHVWPGGMTPLSPCMCGRTLSTGIGFGIVNVDDVTG